MTQVMDGVRRTSVMAMPVLPRRKPVVASIGMESRRYVVGMDGIRRPVTPTPRDVLANIQASAVSAPAMPVTAVLPEAPAAMLSAEASVWQLPSLRLPSIEWQRPAAAFALVVVTTAVSLFAVHAITAPKSTTANAAQDSAPASAPSKSAPGVATVKPGLQSIIDNFVNANTPANWGIVVKDLKTGQTASYQPDRQIASASLYKLFVAERIYQRIDVGQLNYGDPAGGGTGETVDQCLIVMINVSDNDCGRALGGILGWGAQNQALSQEGYTETDMSTPQQTSASDVARLFTRLYDRTLVSPNSEDKFLGLLKDQQVNNRLPQGLPAGTVVAHKTGDLDGVVHDAGIVYGPKTDYLVVVTSGSWNAVGDIPPMFSDLSSQLWSFFEQ
jgi:beta-lactamase class A